MQKRPSGVSLSPRGSTWGGSKSPAACSPLDNRVQAQARVRAGSRQQACKAGWLAAASKPGQQTARLACSPTREHASMSLASRLAAASSSPGLSTSSFTRPSCRQRWEASAGHQPTADAADRLQDGKGRCGSNARMANHRAAHKTRRPARPARAGFPGARALRPAGARSAAVRTRLPALRRATGSKRSCSGMGVG